MRNCLVTKLKDVVDNDNLVKLGVWEIQVNAVPNPTSNTQWFNLIDRNDQYITATIEGDGHFIWGWNYSESGYNLGKQITMQHPTSLIGQTGSGYVYLSNGNYKVIIENKYAINTVCNPACFVYDLDELAFNEFSYARGADLGGYIKGNLDVLTAIPNLILASGARDQPLCYGTVEGLFTSNKTVVAVPGMNISGDISESNLTSNCTNIDISGNTGVTGDISYFGMFVNVEKLYVIEHTGISGTIESLVASFRSHGKTSGEVTTWACTNNNVTFNGQPVSWDRVTDKLVWTANTITCNGVTINA